MAEGTLLYLLFSRIGRLINTMFIFPPDMKNLKIISIFIVSQIDYG
jgi:hypothetical protein